MKSILTNFMIVVLLICILISTQINAIGSGVGTHAVAGGALGYSLAQTDFQAFILGLTSHLFLDIMPHHDPELSNLIDLTFHAFFNLGGLVLMERIYKENEKDSRILWGAIGGVLPDLEHLVFWNKCGSNLCPQKIFPVHNGLLPHHGGAPFWQGYLYESSIITVSLVIAF